MDKVNWWKENRSLLALRFEEKLFAGFHQIIRHAADLPVGVDADQRDMAGNQKLSASAHFGRDHHADPLDLPHV